jgi:hypothetical protein
MRTNCASSCSSLEHFEHIVTLVHTVLLGHARTSFAYNLLEDLRGHTLSVNRVLSNLTPARVALAALRDQLLSNMRSSPIDLM